MYSSTVLGLDFVICVPLTRVADRLHNVLHMSFRPSQPNESHHACRAGLLDVLLMRRSAV